MKNNHHGAIKANKTDAGNGSKAICRVSNVLRSPSPDPSRSPEKMVQRHITFRANHPNDSTMSGGRIVVPGGRILMDSIRLAFRQDGYEVTEINRKRSVWFFDLTGAEGSFRLMIQYIEPWLLVIHDLKPFWKRMFCDEADLKVFSTRTDAIMRSICGLTDLQWTDGEALARR